MMDSQLPPPDPPNSANATPPISSPGAKPPPIPPPILPATPTLRARPPRNGWKIAAIVLAVVLVIGFLGSASRSVLKTFENAGLTPHSRIRGSHLLETLLEDNGSANKIAVIPIEGIILSEGLDRGGSGLVDLIQDQLKLAEDDKRVKAVLLKINSPGGEVLASDDIYQAIEKFQMETGKPVIAVMGSVAASGGYYVAAPCRWIVANELSITGSIGVIMHGYNYRGLMNKVGLRPLVYKSGRFKDMLSADKDLDTTNPVEKAVLDEEARMVQTMIDQTFDKFKSVVAKGRARANEKNGNQGRKLTSRWTDYADGRILSGKDAYELGFVDEMGNWEVAVDRAVTLAGIADANLVMYQQPFDFSNLLRLLGQSNGKSLQIELGPESPRIPTGRLYFLAPMFLH